MTRTVKDKDLSTREARRRLAFGRRHYRAVEDGVAVYYRRGKKGSGAWGVRLRLSDGAYTEPVLGIADDYSEANEADVLSFAQAQQRALAKAAEAKLDEGAVRNPKTVAEACAEYLEWFRAEGRKSVNETEHAINAHILPMLGDKRVADLHHRLVQKWLQGVAAARARVRTAKLATERNFKPMPRTADEKRARQSTANRILNVLKAILNRAAPHRFNEWRQVKGYKGADEARIRFLSDDEGTRLVNACPPDLRALVRGALLTGGRYGELTALRVADVSLRTMAKNGAEVLTGRIYFAPAKTKKGRHVPLNPEGVALLQQLIAGKGGDALVFTKKDASAWGKNHHVRPLAAACAAGKVTPAVSFHELRHTYASHLAQAGVPLLTISKLLGHASTTMTVKHYAHLADRELSAAVTTLPSFEATADAETNVTPYQPKPAWKQSAA